MIGFDGACTIASLRSGRDSVSILFDVAQAFPGLAHIWMFMAQHRMSAARRLVLLIQSMYADNATTLEVSWCPVAEVRVKRAIQQGSCHHRRRERMYLRTLQALPEHPLLLARRRRRERRGRDRRGGGGVRTALPACFCAESSAAPGRRHRRRWRPPPGPGRRGGWRPPWGSSPTRCPTSRQAGLVGGHPCGVPWLRQVTGLPWAG